MTQNHWNAQHRGYYGEADWAGKPSIFAEQAVKFFPKTGEVLDVGTGQGGDAKFFDSLGYAVTATDYSEEAVARARQNSGKVTFLQLDTAQVLPFGDESFDVVYSHMALHYFDKETTTKVLADIARVLKPRGVLAFIVNAIDDPEKDSPGYIELEPGFYRSPKGLDKHYFSVNSIQELTKGLFETSLLDNEGETYKDKINTLVRFVGQKR